VSAQKKIQKTRVELAQPEFFVEKFGLSQLDPNFFEPQESPTGQPSAITNLFSTFSLYSSF